MGDEGTPRQKHHSVHLKERHQRSAPHLPGLQGLLCGKQISGPLCLARQTQGFLCQGVKKKSTTPHHRESSLGPYSSCKRFIVPMSVTGLDCIKFRVYFPSLTKVFPEGSWCVLIGKHEAVDSHLHRGAQQAEVKLLKQPLLGRSIVPQIPSVCPWTG